MTSEAILTIDQFLRTYEAENPGVTRALVQGAMPVPLNLKDLRKVLDMATVADTGVPNAMQMFGLLDRMDPDERARVLAEFFTMPLRDSSERFAALANKMEDWIRDNARGEHRRQGRPG